MEDNIQYKPSLKLYVLYTVYGQQLMYKESGIPANKPVNWRLILKMKADILIKHYFYQNTRVKTNYWQASVDSVLIDCWKT